MEATQEQAEILAGAVQHGLQIVVGDKEGFWQTLLQAGIIKKVEDHPFAGSSIAAYEVTEAGREFLLAEPGASQ